MGKFVKNKVFVQFIKFGLVGLSNTLLSYITQIICYYILFKNTSFQEIIVLLQNFGIASDAESIRIIITTTIAFFVGVTNSFFWNSRYVFTSGTKDKRKPKTYIKTIICYGITGLIISPYLKIILGKSGFPFWISTLLSLVITVPLNFILNKFWTYKDR